MTSTGCWRRGRWSRWCARSPRKRGGRCVPSCCCNGGCAPWRPGPATPTWWLPSCSRWPTSSGSPRRWTGAPGGAPARGGGGAPAASSSTTSTAASRAWLPSMADDLRPVPRHVAIILDGNGRWATGRALPRTVGHAAGEPALFDVVHGALQLGLEWLTAYVFSTENWARSPEEVAFLMHFNEDLLLRRRDELDGLGVGVILIG